jgi:4-hydroxybenzoate polyprenyltransferase
MVSKCIGVLSFLKKILDFLLFTHIFLAVSVSSLVWETELLLHTGTSNLHYPYFLFSATLLLYCFHRIYQGSSITETKSLSERHVWIKNNPFLFYGVLLLAGAGTVVSALFFIRISVLVWLVPIGFISLGYTVPFLPFKGKLIRLRDLPGLKIFLISFVLGLTTVLLPVLSSATPKALLSSDILFVFMRRLFFIFAITLPFDIRDMDYDRQSGITTLPLWLGIKKTRALSMLSLLAFGILCLIQFLACDQKHPAYFLALVLSALVSALVILSAGKTGEKKSDFYYSFCLEGMMLLQCIFIFCASKV